MYDIFSRTPFVDLTAGIPGRAERFTTRSAYAKFLKECKIGPTEEGPCMQGNIFCAIYNRRLIDEMETAMEAGTVDRL